MMRLPVFLIICFIMAFVAFLAFSPHAQAQTSGTPLPTPTPYYPDGISQEEYYNLVETLQGNYVYPFPSSEEISRFFREEAFISMPSIRPEYLRKYRKLAVGVEYLQFHCGAGRILAIGGLETTICTKFFADYYRLPASPLHTPLTDERRFRLLFELKPGQEIVVAFPGYAPDHYFENKLPQMKEFNAWIEYLTSATVEADPGCKDFSLKSVHDPNLDIQLPDVLVDVPNVKPEDVPHPGARDILRNGKVGSIFNRAIITEDRRILYEDPRCTWIRLRGPGWVEEASIRFYPVSIGEDWSRFAPPIFPTASWAGEASERHMEEILGTATPMPARSLPTPSPLKPESRSGSPMLGIALMLMGAMAVLAFFVSIFYSRMKR